MGSMGMLGQSVQVRDKRDRRDRGWSWAPSVTGNQLQKGGLSTRSKDRGTGRTGEPGWPLIGGQTGAGRAGRAGATECLWLGTGKYQAVTLPKTAVCGADTA